MATVANSEAAGAEMVDAHFSEGSHSVVDAHVDDEHVDSAATRKNKKTHTKKVAGFGRLAHGFEGVMAPALAGLSARSARNQCKAIWSVVFFTVVCAVLGMIGFERENSGEVLWTDHDSRQMIARQWRTDNWGAFGIPLMVMIVKKDCINREDPEDISKCGDVLGDGSLFDASIDLAMKIDTFTMTYASDIVDFESKEKREWSYADGCDELVGSHHKDCSANVVTNFFDRDEKILKSKTRA